MRRFLLRVVAALVPLVPASPALAGGAGLIGGPVTADVERVIDGDTFVAVAHVWPGNDVHVSVRIRGIDAPEIHSRCAAERAAAHRARDRLEALLASGPVLLGNVGGGKYYGRVLADVTSADGQPAARLMLGDGLARAYQGGRRRPYCG